MASKLESKASKSWINDYIYVNANGIPVCSSDNAGLSRKIQMEYKSKEFCTLDDGTYYHCKYPLKPRTTTKSSFLTTDITGKHPNIKKNRTSNKLEHRNIPTLNVGSKTACCIDCARNKPCQGKIENSLLPKCITRQDNTLRESTKCFLQPKSGKLDLTVAQRPRQDSRSPQADSKTDGTEAIKDKAESVMTECLRKFGKLADMEDRVRKTIEKDEKKPKFSDVLDKYRWKAEIHGDPYKLKPIHQRLPYSVPMAYQTVEGQWPQYHYKFNSPFFYNTIPAHRYSFVIHPDFLSEFTEDFPPPKKAVFFK